jgi:hypothetical protein
MLKSGGVAVALGGGLVLISHSPKCLRIFLMAYSSFLPNNVAFFSTDLLKILYYISSCH